jgi:hypothetical protein
MAMLLITPSTTPQTPTQITLQTFTLAALIVVMTVIGLVKAVDSPLPP